MKKTLKGIYNKAKAVLKKPEQAKATIKFKKEIWQTDEISQAFIKGSDSDVHATADIMNKEVNGYFLANCNKQDWVLDIGCGHGIVSEFLGENGIKVSAVDISEKLLDDFKKRIEGKNLPIDISKADAYNLAFPDNQFDVVVARMFLPHFPDWPVVLKEIARVTKKGGKIMIHGSSDENTQLGKKLALHPCVFATSPDTSNPWNFYAETNDAELNKICSKIGLSLTQRAPISFFLHNRVLGYQLGTEKYNKYMANVQEFFKDEKVREFVLWFDNEVISQCSPALSHFNIITFRKDQ